MYDSRIRCFFHWSTTASDTTRTHTRAVAGAGAAVGGLWLRQAVATGYRDGRRISICRLSIEYPLSACTQVRNKIVAGAFPRGRALARTRAARRAGLFGNANDRVQLSTTLSIADDIGGAQGRHIRRLTFAMKLLKSKKEKKILGSPYKQRRQDKGEFHRLVRELESDDEKFHQYFRMNQAQYEEIHSLIEGDIKSTYEIS
ncbi:hypothetical protein EVAR_19000_1 [Eumeta japonica]|uniref:Uncharacterized protein n=1 Tax=Eumeta variegata TaxID=151549 RepID=A0A4C1V7F0_EUMVA|nr:hypothetical protein EVAR_19000_1 [Eumeta japonica]